MAVKKDEKTKTWYYYGRFTNILGEKKQYKKRGFRTKAEAKAAEQEFLISQKESTFSMKVDDVFNEYIIYSKGNKKQVTIYKDSVIYNRFIKKAFGDKNIKSITPKQVIVFRSTLMEQGNKNSYVNFILSTFNKLFTYVEKIYGIKYNPVKVVGKVKEEKREYNVWTMEEFSAFIKVVDNDMLKVAYTILFMTGIRRGELLGLQWKDYDGKYISINKTYAPKVGSYALTSPKTTNSIRKVELDQKTIELIESYKEYAMQFDGFNDEFFIIGDKHPVGVNRLMDSKKKYEDISGVPSIRIHDFRHSHVTLLINNNIPIPAIAKRVGDDIATIISTYSHLLDKSDKELIDFLNNQKF